MYTRCQSQDLLTLFTDNDQERISKCLIHTIWLCQLFNPAKSPSPRSLNQWKPPIQRSFRMSNGNNAATKPGILSLLSNGTKSPRCGSFRTLPTTARFSLSIACLTFSSTTAILGCRSGSRLARNTLFIHKSGLSGPTVSTSDPLMAAHASHSESQRLVKVEMRVQY